MTKKHLNRTVSSSSSISCYYSPRISLFIIFICVTFFVLFQIQSLQVQPPTSSPSSSPSWPNSFIHQWQQQQEVLTNNDCTSITEKLRQSVTFLPLKDIRYTNTALQGHTWFMSSMYDTHKEGEVQYQQFPSESSHDRLLCIKGRDTHDGAWNNYGLAWPEALPINSTIKKGLTFISYNHYNYENIWHGLSAMVPFVAWHKQNDCELPDRWILYHWGELRFGMGPWLNTLMEATFNGMTPPVERFDGVDDVAVCFEKAVVMRHNEGGMSREKRMEVYDLMRCKARIYCNVSLERKDEKEIGLTLFMRTGARSFRNESVVIKIFETVCGNVNGCRFMAAYSNNLTFCEQVQLMSRTDILISPHGAQLTNMFLMDRNSSVMEFFPKGWLKLAGVGQFVYQWIASWSGMRHQGTWRDPDGENCPFPEDDRRCMSVYKSGTIGYNETYFSEWATNVLNEVKTRKLEEASSQYGSASVDPHNHCVC